MTIVTINCYFGIFQTVAKCSPPLLCGEGATNRTADFAAVLVQIKDALNSVWEVKTALFEICIGLYIEKEGLESTCGAADSVVIVSLSLYPAHIVLIGTEFTNVYTKAQVPDVCFSICFRIAKFIYGIGRCNGDVRFHEQGFVHEDGSDPRHKYMDK